MTSFKHENVKTNERNTVKFTVGGVSKANFKKLDHTDMIGSSDLDEHVFEIEICKPKKVLPTFDKLNAIFDFPKSAMLRIAVEGTAKKTFGEQALAGNIKIV